MGSAFTREDLDTCCNPVPEVRHTLLPHAINLVVDLFLVRVLHRGEIQQDMGFIRERHNGQSIVLVERVQDRPRRMLGQIQDA
jgi:hypothetical protein